MAVPRNLRWGECSGGPAGGPAARQNPILQSSCHDPLLPRSLGGRGSPERSRGGLPAPDSCTPVRSTICPFRADGMLPAILWPTVFAVSPAVLRAGAAPATMRGSRLDWPSTSAIQPVAPAVRPGGTNRGLQVTIRPCLASHTPCAFPSSSPDAQASNRILKVTEDGHKRPRRRARAPPGRRLRLPFVQEGLLGRTVAKRPWACRAQ